MTHANTHGQTRRPVAAPVKRPTYVVTRRDGTVLNQGDKITDFRGEERTYWGCWHDRKITYMVPGDPDSPHLYAQSDSQHDAYADVFDLQITDANTGCVTFVLSATPN